MSISDVTTLNKEGGINAESNKIQLLRGNCLELMKEIPDKSVDMILADLPYGVTACRWDEVIPFEKLWPEYERVCKSNGVIVLFGTEPFASAMRLSNKELYRYDWIWEKSKCSNFLSARKQPLKYHENILVFSKPKSIYNPQLSEGKPYKRDRTKEHFIIPTTKNTDNKTVTISDGRRYPKTILRFKSEQHNVHPTQKPVALLEYLIKTYTNEGDIVLDNCMGSGSTGVACVNLNRDFIGMELKQEYFNIAKERIHKAQTEPKQITFEIKEQENEQGDKSNL